MCQQQFEKEVSYELFQCLDEKRELERKAEVICECSLAELRRRPNSTIGQWLEGRANAAAIIYRTPETASSANECRFLAGQYLRRVRELL